jgi:hypothetical protein
MNGKKLKNAKVSNSKWVPHTKMQGTEKCCKMQCLHVTYKHKTNMGHLLRTVINTVMKGRPNTDTTHDTELLDLNGLLLGHGLHSQKSFANTAYHIVNGIRQIVVKNIVLQQNTSVITDKSTEMLWVKILHVVHLITGVAKTSNPVFLF